MLLKVSTARNRSFLLVQSADHLTGLTGAAPTVTLSKDGGAFAAAGGTVTEIANGVYKIALTTTDTNTKGDLFYHVTAASADATDFADQVVTDLPGDSIASVTGSVGSVTGGVTVTTNNDKTGYSLTQAFPTNFSSLSIDVSGRVDLGKWIGTAPAAVTASGYVQSALLRWLTDNAAGTPNALISGRVDANAQVVGDKAGYSLTQTFPTNFSSLAITAGGAVTVGTNNDKTGYSLSATPPTSAQIATAVWQDTSAGDFTVVSSIGKSLYTSGNAPGAASGLALVGSNMGSVSSVTGAVGSVTGNVGGNVVGSVGSVTAGVTLAAGAVDSVALATSGINAIWAATTRNLTGSQGIKKNTAKAGFLFAMTDSTNHNPATGLTVTAQRSLDGAAFAGCTNSVVEVGSGWYKIDLAAGDLNGDTVALKFTGASADQLNISLVTSS